MKCAHKDIGELCVAHTVYSLHYSWKVIRTVRMILFHVVLWMSSALCSLEN